MTAFEQLCKQMAGTFLDNNAKLLRLMEAREAERLAARALIESATEGYDWPEQNHILDRELWAKYDEAKARVDSLEAEGK